jgi:hypothetical protein
VLALSFPEPRFFGAEERGFLTAAAQQCAQAPKRARLREAERAAGQRAASLAAASAALVGSLDYEATLGQVARLVVPALADWCVVDLLEPVLRRLGPEQPDPAGRVGAVVRHSRSATARATASSADALASSSRQLFTWACMGALQSLDGGGKIRTAALSGRPRGCRLGERVTPTHETAGRSSRRPACLIGGASARADAARRVRGLLRR